MKLGESDINSFFNTFGEEMKKGNDKFIVIFDNEGESLPIFSTTFENDRTTCLISNYDLIKLNIQVNDEVVFVNKMYDKTAETIYVVSQIFRDHTGISNLKLQYKFDDSNNNPHEVDPYGY